MGGYAALIPLVTQGIENTAEAVNGDPTQQAYYNAMQQLAKSDPYIAKMLNSDPYNPGAQQSTKLGPSAVANYREDPGQLAARNQALAQLQQRGQGGYNVEDQAAIQQALDTVGAQERGNQQAIMQHMNPNSGMAISAQLGNNAAATQNAYSTGLQRAAAGRQAAMQALAQSGGLANQSLAGDFSRAQGMAQDQDAISKWNAQNTADVGRQNLDRAMQSHMQDMSQRIQELELLRQSGQGQGQLGIQAGQYQQGRNDQLAKGAGAAGTILANNLGGSGGSQSGNTSTPSYASTTDENGQSQPYSGIDYGDTSGWR